MQVACGLAGMNDLRRHLIHLLDSAALYQHARGFKDQPKPQRQGSAEPHKNLEPLFGSA